MVPSPGLKQAGGGQGQGMSRLRHQDKNRRDGVQGGQEGLGEGVRPGDVVVKLIRQDRD